jgi:hypothetical protein
MKKQYDFSKGERGKFFDEDAQFNLPVYLESDVRKFVEQIAKKKKTNVNSIVNTIIKKNIQLTKSLSV